MDLAGDAGAATKQLQQDRYDVVILDIRMPGMSGIDLLQKIIARNRQQSVILNTSYSSYRRNFLTWLAEAYVVKSFSTNDLKQAIRNVLTKQS